MNKVISEFVNRKLEQARDGDPRALLFALGLAVVAIALGALAPAVMAPGLSPQVVATLWPQWVMAGVLLVGGVGLVYTCR